MHTFAYLLFIKYDTIGSASDYIYSYYVCIEYNIIFLRTQYLMRIALMYVSIFSYNSHTVRNFIINSPTDEYIIYIHSPMIGVMTYLPYRQIDTTYFDIVLPYDAIYIP